MQQYHLPEFANRQSSPVDAFRAKSPGLQLLDRMKFHGNLNNHVGQICNGRTILAVGPDMPSPRRIPIPDNNRCADALRPGPSKLS
jgi:hypothetical protein